MVLRAVDKGRTKAVTRGLGITNLGRLHFYFKIGNVEWCYGLVNEQVAGLHPIVRDEFVVITLKLRVHGYQLA